MSGSVHRETADDYVRVVLRFGEWRVSECRDGIQWLLQRRRPGFSGVGTAWDTVSYCVTRNALNRLWTAATGDARALGELNLPATFKGTRL